MNQIVGAKLFLESHLEGQSNYQNHKVKHFQMSY